MVNLCRKYCWQTWFLLRSSFFDLCHWFCWSESSLWPTCAENVWWFLRKVKQTELRHFLLPGFGNRCIQPKGPRRPPLEWTWWNSPAARPPPLSSLVRRWGLPTSPGWSKNQDDRCYAFHRKTFWVTVCQYPPLPPPPPQSSLQSATVPSRDSQEARMFSSSACWCWQVWLL